MLFVSVNTYANSSDLFDIDTCTVAISPSDTIIYSDNPIQLQLNGTQGADYYHWTPEVGLSNPTIFNPIATINNSVQYVLEAYYIGGENLVYNGDFELGNLGFTTELNLSTDLWPAGNYNIVTLGSRYHYMFSSCTHNGGKFFVANGASTPNLIVYQTTVSVLPNTNYEFSFEATNVCPTATPEQLPQFQFSINSQQLGDVFSTPFSPCTWTKFHKFWNSGTNTTATITILNQNIVAGGNDFGIDNVALRVVCKASDTINISLTTANVDTCTVEIFQNDTTYYTSEPPFFVQLNASQGADYYNWIPATGLSDPQIFNPIAQITNSIEYVLEACFAGDSNLVYNGDFELGNIGFFTDYLISSAPQIPRGSFKIVSNSNQANYGNTSCTNGGLFFAADASPSVGARVYQSTSPVEPNTDYIFSVDVTATYVETSADYPIMQYAINGEQLGNPITIGAGVCNWITTSKIWNSGNNTTATINIINQNTVGMGNDFAIDNIALRKICKAYDTINIILVDPSTIPKEISVKICEKDFPYTYYDSVFYGVGDYGYVFSTDGEIDSLYILNISTYPHYDITIYDTICEGQTYSNNGFEASSSGLYTNTFSTINGCDSLINLSLFVYPLTDTIINAYICEGEVYNQYGFNLANQGTYYNTYSFGEKCERNIVLHLIVIDVPEMLLFPQNDIMVEEYPITLDATCMGCDSYMWNTGSFSPSINVYSKGIYRVCAYSNCGTVCDSVSINNPDVYVFLPNSFTPNEASNNVFEIYTEKEKIELVSFEIFSRWGERVFETKDINMGWDGMFKGRLCNSDNFVFKVLFKTRYTGNLIYEKVGKVSLIR